MGNVLRILKRDHLRLLKTPAAMVVAIALLVLPSLYTWYNVEAFWNPYEATGNLTVCVVNQDKGAESELTGKLTVGDTVEEELLANDKLNFISEDFDTALDDLKAGRVYAVYVIPEDFSECLISPLTGKVETPVIKYYVNEKLGPVSPKITDTAATTLDQTINSAFVETVTESSVDAVNEALYGAETDITSARSVAAEKMNQVITDITEVREKLADITTVVTDAKTKTATARTIMDDALRVVIDAQTVLNDITGKVSTIQANLSNITSGSITSLSSILADVSQVTAKASTAADGFVARAGTAQSRIGLATGKVQPLLDAMAEIVSDLNAVANALPDDNPNKGTITASAQEIANLQGQLQTVVNDAQALATRVANASQAAANAAASLDQTAQQATNALQKYSDDLYGGAAPTINDILAKVSIACGKLSTAISNLETTIKQAQASLDQLSALLTDCESAISQTDKLLGGLQGDVESISADVSLLSRSGAIADIMNGETLEPESISTFMATPTQLKTEKMYSINAYGTAMAPLFMNLTFWIGAFMLVIIFKIEVDDEGMRGITHTQRYFSRFMFFAGFAAIQAVICCIGVLVQGVEAANVPALFLAAVVSSLAYLSIIYALSATLHHIGKALCIILVFAQIPGGSGLYPLELTDGFFQAIYPFLPFSYGIGALREAIAGFYGNYFVHDIAILIIILAVMLVLGMVIAPLMSNVIRMVARQVHEGDLYNGEEAVVPVRPFYLSQVVRALSDREDFHEDLERRYAKFSKRYPIFIRASIVLGVGGPLALALLFVLDAGEKVTLLTIFLLWLVALVVFLVIVESLRYSFERQLNIQRMSNETLLGVFFDRNNIRPAYSVAQASGPRPGDVSELASDPEPDGTGSAEEVDDA